MDGIPPDLHTTRNISHWCCICNAYGWCRVRTAVAGTYLCAIQNVTVSTAALNTTAHLICKKTRGLGTSKKPCLLYIRTLVHTSTQAGCYRCAKVFKFVISAYPEPFSRGATNGKQRKHRFREESGARRMRGSGGQESRRGAETLGRDTRILPMHACV